MIARLLRPMLPAAIVIACLPGISRLAPARADQALVVGVNHYPGISKGDLHGCVNDAQSVAQTLQDYGFKTRVLLDGQATKSAVIETIHAMRSARPTERIVFYFAGHGTQTPSGGARLMVSDALQESTANDISRDELYDAVKEVPARARTVILDSCFSGAMMRSIRRAGKDTRYYDRATRGGNEKSLRREKDSMDPGSTPAPNQLVCYYAASGSNEQAAEDDFGNVRHGVFTQFLVTELKKSTASKSLTWDDLDRSVCQQIREYLSCTQTPKLTERYRSCSIFDAPAGNAPHPVEPAPFKPDRTIWDQFNHGNPDPTRLQLVMEPNLNTIKVNDSVHFSLKLGETGYLVVLELGTDGKIAPIFPEDLTVEAAHVKSGQTVHLPLDEHEHYRPDEAGTELLRAVLYSSKEAAEQLIKSFAEKRSIVFKEFVSQGREKSLRREKDKPFDIYTAELTFEVVPASEVAP